MNVCDVWFRDSLCVRQGVFDGRQDERFEDVCSVSG